MTEQKKSQIRKTVSVIEVVLAAVMIGYLVYGIATKNLNTTISNVLAIAVVVTCVVLNDFVEPYLTEVFVNMDDFKKEAYKKYVLWDVASMAGLLFFVLNFAQEGSMIAVLKMDKEELKSLCSEVGVYPVNYNCPGQIVVSGLKSSMPAFEERVKEKGGRCIPLAVSFTVTVLKTTLRSDNE